MKRAFTLIELLVVIGIIGILMGVLISTFSGSSESARAAKCQTNMRNLAMAVQAKAMETGYFPVAGSLQKKNATAYMPGWISWSSRGTSGSYIDPYGGEQTARNFSLTNGAIWKAMNGSRESYVCPEHQRYAMANKKKDPLWSYAMNAYFGWAGTSGTPRSSDYYGRHYRSFRRSDRFLLFAELPYAKMKVGGAEIQTGSDSGKALDPVLDYAGGEVIGFNHKDGKNVMGHVCFADGHVEKLRAPTNKSNVKELTRWLCNPTDKDKGDFDISFSDGTYKQDFSGSN